VVLHDADSKTFMVSLSNHEGCARTAAQCGASWFDRLTMKRFL